jgi:hypothetical protein
MAFSRKHDDEPAERQFIFGKPLQAIGCDAEIARETRISELCDTHANGCAQRFAAG